VRVILGSASSRRVELLKRVFDNFIVHPSNIDENITSNLSVIKHAKLIAQNKLIEVRKHFNKDDLIITADTIVVYKNIVYGKPLDNKHAFEMLSVLSGNKHEVISAYAISYNDNTIVNFDKTTVTFSQITAEEINKYISLDNCCEYAGSYAIQGIFSKFVKKINGNIDNVIGLPLAKLVIDLKNMEIS